MSILQKVAFLCILACSIAYAPFVAGLDISVNYNDGAGEGFNDLSVGAARRAAFEHAVSIWAGHLDGTIPLVIKAEFNDLAAGVLGQRWTPLFGH